MGLYLENGYVDIKWIRERELAFNFICGGRGTGKTYGVLSNILDTKETFMYMRRQQKQVDEATTAELSPFKRINYDRNIYITTQPISKYSSAFYRTEKQEDGTSKAVGLPIGYTCALSTISNLRGFDASDCTVLVYDEFIPERQERAIRNEGQAFFNAYETINRNRELEGKKPLQVLALSNSNSLANPIFMEMGVVKIIENMKKKNLEYYINKDKSLGIFLLDKSEISEKKKHTALYKLAPQSSYNNMALNNDFVYDDMTYVKPVNLKDYAPLVNVGELCIYKHRSEYLYYVCGHSSGKVVTYSATETDRAKFKKLYYWLYNSYIDGHVLFEEYIHLALFVKYFDTNY